MHFFDFSEIKKSESSIKRTWGEYREALATKKISLMMLKQQKALR